MAMGVTYRDLLYSALFENELDDIIVLGCAELSLECLVARLVVDALYTLPEITLVPSVARMLLPHPSLIPMDM
jgi:hypothetical protein